MAKFEFVAWLAHWLFSLEDPDFEWDEGNTVKSSEKHRISIESSEQVFRNRDLLVPLGIQVEPRHDEPRFGALGMDNTGNKLFVNFTVREGRIRVISIRPMSRIERKHYASVREE